MSRTPRVIDGDPTTFNANGAGVLPGDVVMDFSGAVPGVSIIERTAPTTNTRVLLAPASSIPVLPVADVVVVSQSSTGPGNLTVRWAITNLGAPAVNRGVSLAMESDGIVGWALSLGALVMHTTALDLLALGMASALGLVELTINGVPGSTVLYILQTNGGVGVVDSGSVVLPV